MTDYGSATRLDMLALPFAHFDTCKGPLQWHNPGLKVAILFAGTTLLNHTILFARFYGSLTPHSYGLLLGQLLYDSPYIGVYVEYR